MHPKEMQEKHPKVLERTSMEMAMEVMAMVVLVVGMDLLKEEMDLLKVNSPMKMRRKSIRR